MIGAGAPAAVRRFAWRLLAVSALLLALCLVLWAMARRDGLRREADHERGFRLHAQVAASYDGGDLVPVTYEHPLTGAAETEAGLWSLDAPEAGADVEIIAARNDPRDVLLVGDDYPVTSVRDLGYGVIVALIPIVAAALRLHGVRRLGRLMASDSPSFAMLATVSGGWPDGRRARLHLFPADARPGARPLCSIPLLTTTGPPAGPAFPVEVKGSPRPLGRAVVRHEGQVLWPRGRAASHSASASMPEQVGPPNPFPPADVIPVRRVGRWLRYAAVGWAAGAGACALLLVTTVVTLVHRAQAQDLERDGVEVVAEITEAESGTYSLGVVYSLPGEHEVREGRAAVDFPEDWDVGGRYPAVVDPDAPRRLRLLTEPYDAVAPIVWAAIPAAVVSPWLVWSGRRWRRQQRAGGGRWITADSWVLGYRTSPTYGRVVELAIARPGAMAPSCLIRVPPDPWLDGPRWVRRRLDITEVTAVGDPLAVRIGDRLLFPVRAARTPRRT